MKLCLIRLSALDAEIEDFTLTLEPNFQALYADKKPLTEYNLTYADKKRVPISDEANYKASVESVVYITAESINGFNYYGSGSILTSDGLILTNYHVIEDSRRLVATTADGRHFAAESVVLSDEALDITLIKIDAEGLRPIPIGDSDSVVVGQKTLVIGHAEGLLNTLSVGNVAGIRMYESREAGETIQITNPISSGNSGGALLNKYGELIGVPTWAIEYENNIQQVQNLNFSVSINEVLELLNSDSK